MASRNNNVKTGPADLKVRVAVIEYRTSKEDDWAIYHAYFDSLPTEVDLVCFCTDRSESITGSEWRYRYATLTFDDDGRKATIY